MDVLSEFTPKTARQHAASVFASLAHYTRDGSHPAAPLLDNRAVFSLQSKPKTLIAASEKRFAIGEIGLQQLDVYSTICVYITRIPTALRVALAAASGADYQARVARSPMVLLAPLR